MEGTSRDRLKELIRLNEDNSTYSKEEVGIFKALERACEELDPWLPIDEDTPKDQDLLITNKSKRKYVGRLFSPGVWCVQGKLDFIPTHYKALSGPEE